jgi:NAD(P)-dependent dehydrogenase (short-subunit alcohol dehydrogenase family)
VRGTPVDARNDDRERPVSAAGDQRETAAGPDGRGQPAMAGRLCLVVGAGGIGTACALALADAGAVVVTADRDVTRARNAAPFWHAVDVTDEADVEALVERVIAEHGRIDALVNATGITHVSPAETFPADTFDTVLAVNLRGPFLLCRSVGSHMLERNEGAIVNISSVAGSAALTESVAYCASKGAIDQLTRTLAVEWAPRGVRVNAVAPSWIRTPILDALTDRQDLLAQRVASVPLGRLGEPHEVAAAVVFLCSPAASLITGAILPADGGFLAQ